MQEVTVTLTGKDARKKVYAGVKKVYDAVKLTLGPEGRNAILPRTWARGPRMTNDGVTIAENIMPGDEHEKLATEYFTEGASKTNKIVGDGTTSTTVFSANIVLPVLADSLGGQVTLGNGGKYRSMRHDILAEKDKILALIKERAVKIESIEQLQMVAFISIGEKEIADAVADMVWRVARGKDGSYVDNHIDITEGYKQRIEVEVMDGMRFPAKVAHRGFVTNEARAEMEAADVPVLITSYKFESALEVKNLIERLKLTRCAFFTPGFSMPVLAMFMQAQASGIGSFFPVLCPALRTPQLEDAALYTGAKFIDKDKHSLRTIELADLGFAEKIVVKDSEQREDAVLLGGRQKLEYDIVRRIDTLKEALGESRNDLDRISLEKRIANLNAAVGVIRVGATTNAELLYLKHKVEDGVYACKAALQEGYVKGGGVCLKEIADELETSILDKALRAPYEQIQENAGGVLEIEDDVIDPAKVVRLTVEHGCSIAAQLITTDILIAEPRDRKPYEGDALIARAIGKGAYYKAKHDGMLAEAEDEAESDRERAFEEALLSDRD